jgi:hypothetical protein
MAVQDGGGEDPGEAIKARYLAKCVQRSSVVLHAVYGHIRCPSTFDVVLGKVRQGPYHLNKLNIIVIIFIFISFFIFI